MPQIAIIQLPAQAPAPSPPSSSPETGGFAPHLDQALKNRDTQNRDSQSASSSPGKANKPKEIESTTSPDQDDSEILQTKGETNTNIDLLIERLLVIASEQQQNSQTNSEQQAGSPVNLGQAINALLETPATGDSNGDIARLLTDTASTKGYSPSEDLLAKQGQTLPQNLAATATSEPSEENPLLQQLQRIIDSGEQDITLTITDSGKTNRISTNGGAISLKTDTLPQQPIEVVASTVTAEAGDTPSPYLPVKTEIAGDQPQAPASRNSLQQQYLESKMTVDTTSESESGTDDGSQQQHPSTTGKSGFLAESTSGMTSTDSPSAFSQPLAQAQEGLKPLGQEVYRPITLPSGTTVHQEEVIRQIAERFTVTPRDGNTRVNLQLHPAELGELRIDLTVKNGTVRANVIASTQVSQEIIEKNMPKLRSILENQGFTVDELSVAKSSRSIDEFNLFDQHLFGRNDSSSPAPQQGGKPAAIFSLDGSLAQESVFAGVNVKI